LYTMRPRVAHVAMHYTAPRRLLCFLPLNLPSVKLIVR
jgi:hypothetical protein